MKLIKTTKQGLLKFNAFDAVSGNVLAQKLNIEHSKMMRTIKRVMKQEENRKKDTVTSGVIFHAIFKEFSYVDSMNRTRKTFILNEDAAYLVIASSQSAKAHELKVWFKSEFNNMKLERFHREESKQLLESTTDALQKLFFKLRAEGSTQNETFLYNNFHKKSYKAITGKKHIKGHLEELTHEEACDLAELRHNASKQLELMLLSDKDAKAIRADLWSFIEGYSS